MRVLGLDVGDRRIGIAMSDSLGLTAQRLSLLERETQAEDIETIGGLLTKYDVEAIVIGLPITLAGKHGAQAQRVMAFARALSKRVGTPVKFVDERLTTVQGERALIETGTSRRKRKHLLDQVAAQLILQQFLDAQRAKE